MTDAPSIGFVLTLGILVGAGSWELLRQWLNDEFGGTDD